MLAQIILTPTEAKKFIAKAIVQVEVVKRAAEKGIIAIHPSSTTYFIAEELLGKKPSSNTWVCGVIAPKGACMEMGPTSSLPPPEVRNRPQDPGDFKHTYVIRQGQFSTHIPLSQILESMGPGDVYFKGANALDPQGNLGVLAANPVEGGTIGRVLATCRRRGFTILWPTGLEKLIPTPIAEAAKVARRKSFTYSMGMPCSLIPCEGKAFTEIDAVQILGGAKAVPISAGGLGGAEGAFNFAVQGSEAEVQKVIQVAEQCKGARLPPVRMNSCQDCPIPHCFSMKDKPWVERV
jgi:hypothetical protein